MTKTDISIEACIYEDGCHNPSVQKHFADGAEWAKEKMIEEVLHKFCDTCSYQRMGPCGMFPCKRFTNFKKAITD